MNGLNLGVIGLGKFGSFWRSMLASKFHCQAEDRIPKTYAYEWWSSKATVFLCVPESALPEVFQQIRQAYELCKEAGQPFPVIADCCSLKVKSCQMMIDLLPEGIKKVGMHPLFGPPDYWYNPGFDFRAALLESKLAVCNINVPEAELLMILARLTSAFGLRPVQCTPDYHDKMMVSQAFVHFLARTAQSMDLGVFVDGCPLATQTFVELCKIFDKVNGNSDELFRNIQSTDYAKTMREILLAHASALHKSLEPPTSITIPINGPGPD